MNPGWYNRVGAAMSAVYLIDGYNLLHAMGVLRGRVGPNGLEKARQRLLGLLAGGFGDEATSVTVVFDAANAPPGAAEALEFRGLHVRFAVRQDEADDLIEELLRRESAPRRVTLVSDDHRLQQAARRRGCSIQGCGDFLDWLARHRRQRTRQLPETAEERARTLGRDTQLWLAEFADLADDPDFRELFAPYDFEI
jgi:predicted RNA-binding protein with PIN domain